MKQSEHAAMGLIRQPFDTTSSLLSILWWIEMFLEDGTNLVPTLWRTPLRHSRGKMSLAL